MKTNYLYIKIEQTVIVTNKKVFLKDISTIYCTDNTIEKKVGNMILITIDSEKNIKISFSIMKIVDLISKQFPDVEIINMGEIDFILDYKVPKKSSLSLEYLKTAIIALIIFFGSAFTIMTFNTDVSVADLFSKIYKLVLGHNGKDYKVLEISYSIGIGLGIIIFFNHFSRLKLSKDPTPLQIEMRTYEKNLNTTIISNASREGKTKDI